MNIYESAYSVKENYLKALFVLSNDDGQVNLTELSRHLKVTKPTANHMIKSLEVLGWVINEKYKPIVLTSSGKKVAALIIRKHRLTEMFLHEVMKFGWEEVHEVAEQIEHIDSPLLFDRMDEMLGFPTIDPHGSPIPDREGNMIQQNLIPLTEVSEGEHGVLAALANSSQELLRYLNKCKIELGTKIEVTGVEQFDGSRTIKYGENDGMMISEKVAGSLLMKVREIK